MQNTMLDSAVSSNSQELSNASSAIKLFENPLFRVRVIMRLGDPWVVAKDVATCIEHSNVSKMCELCRDKDKVVESASNFDSNDLLESGNALEPIIQGVSGTSADSADVDKSPLRNQGVFFFSSWCCFRYTISPVL